MHAEYVAKSKSEVGASRCVGKIAVDGRLDESDWKQADFITGFTAQDGKPAAPQTFVRILYDRENLYFGFEALESESARMKAPCTKKDGPLWLDNGAEFFVAAPHGNGKYLHLIVNSNGVCYDSLGTGVGGADVGFDAGAEVKTATLADRWVLEVRFPTAALGTAIADGDVWKINVARNRHLTDGTAQGSSLCGGVYHGVEAFRSVAFGGKGLILNGDFEDVEKPSAWKHKTKWQFATDTAPASWTFHDYAGTAALARRRRRVGPQVPAHPERQRQGAGRDLPARQPPGGGHAGGACQGARQGQVPDGDVPVRSPDAPAPRLAVLRGRTPSRRVGVEAIPGRLPPRRQDAAFPGAVRHVRPGPGPRRRNRRAGRKTDGL